MTLQEAEDTIAREMGYKSWGNAMQSRKLDKEHLIEEVARLYAKSKWDEACDEQRDRCVTQFINSDLVKVNQFSAREYCANAPKPIFKP